MLLNDHEIRRALDRVQAAFPRFGEWEYVNEIDDNHGGFAVWGEFVLEPNEPSGSPFFITFDTYETTWSGHLTVGQHCFFWSEQTSATPIYSTQALVRRWKKPSRRSNVKLQICLMRFPTEPTERDACLTRSAMLRATERERLATPMRVIPCRTSREVRAVGKDVYCQWFNSKYESAMGTSAFSRLRTARVMSPVDMLFRGLLSNRTTRMPP